MKLLIVESPSKAKTISKYLGKDYVVVASVGHVRDLPKSNKKAVDIEGGFIPHYEVVAKKQIIIDDIRAKAAKASEILIATDPDREGEAIAWHIKELLTKKSLGGNVDHKKIKRVTYHEVTKEAVEEALKVPRNIDENLKEAQEARRVLDRLVGYDLSGLIWKKVRYGLSAGRVQSPALRIIMEREREIRDFKSEKFWRIAGMWKNEASSDIPLTCIHEPRDRNEVDRIIDTAKSNDWHVIDISESEQNRPPRAPFITSTLQQTASSRLGFSPSRTMSIAQKLYEAGHITYMRTDSTHLSKQALAQIFACIEKQFGKQYVSPHTFTAKSKNAQEAHEAIRPSHIEKVNAGSTDEQKRLYKLIWQRTMASQMKDATIARTKITANVVTTSADSTVAGGDKWRLSRSEEERNEDTSSRRGGRVGVESEPADAVKSIPDFEANGSRLIFDGWIKADPESRGDDVNLPACKEGEKLTLIDINAEEKATQPPGRYTEAGLIKELEKRGIGRPSTYATISRTIEDRGYVEKENRSLKPTDTGEVVSSFLEDNFPSYISDNFTADMENQLDEIADGKRTYEKTLKDFYIPFAKEVKAKDKIAKLTNLGKADPMYKCPKCGSSMDIKLGKNGKFLSCSRYPDCDGALTIDGKEYKKDEPIGTDPTTGLPIFVLNGRFGPYVQLGETVKKKRKTKSENENPTPQKSNRASIPKDMDPMKVTVADALKYLSVPRTLGKNPRNDLDVVASNGRFGPYVVCNGEFRSIKVPDNVYDITLDRALELLNTPKVSKRRGPRSAKS